MYAQPNDHKANIKYFLQKTEEATYDFWTHPRIVNNVSQSAQESQCLKWTAL